MGASGDKLEQAKKAHAKEIEALKQQHKGEVDTLRSIIAELERQNTQIQAKLDELEGDMGLQISTYKNKLSGMMDQLDGKEE